MFAHNVHPTDDELALLAERGATRRALPDQQLRRWAAACSRCDRHLAAGVPGGAGLATSAPAPGFSLFKEGLQAYFLQQLLGADGVPLTSAHLLHLATAAGAAALGLADEIGDLSVGQALRRAVAAPGAGRPR